MPDLIVHCGNGDNDLKVAHCQFPDLTNNDELLLFRETNNKSSGAPIRMTSMGRFTATMSSVPDATRSISSAQRQFIWNYTSCPYWLMKRRARRLRLCVAWCLD